VTKASPSLFFAKSGSTLEILEKLRRGDREAFEIFFEESFLRVYRHFRRRLRSAADAERATETALTAVFSALCEGRSQLPLPRWILGQVRLVKVRGLKALPEAASA
jgi:DNA-directed RNA polymerase specialized sigma24 family protein